MKARFVFSTVSFMMVSSELMYCEGSETETPDPVCVTVGVPPVRQLLAMIFPEMAEKLLEPPQLVKCR